MYGYKEGKGHFRANVESGEGSLEGMVKKRGRW